MSWIVVRFFVLNAFSESFAREYARMDLVVESSSWRVNWIDRIISAKNVTVSSWDGSALFEARGVELDFSLSVLLHGWGEGIYQVYVHQPTIFIEGSVASNNWTVWLEHLRQEKLQSGSRFLLERFYADVVTVNWLNGLDETVFDNGVLTARNLYLPIDDRGAESRFEFYARAGGGKLSLTGSANPLRWQQYSWSPLLGAALALEGVDERVSVTLGTPQNGVRLLTAGR